MRKNVTGRRLGFAVAALALAATGLTGAAGTAAADTTVRTVMGPEMKAGETSYAQCPEGTQLIGGGYAANGAFANNGDLLDTVDVSAPSAYRQGAWAAQIHTGTIRAYALCDSASAPTKAVAGPSVDSSQTSYAQCPENTSLISGGFVMSPSYSYGGAAYDMIEVNAPSQYRQNAWAAKAASGYAAAYALCRS
ncbi:hypothetical protein GCM10023347_25790 [Streptomyces chumphonensis]|uniref:Secreted protein n=1 Tax=Streptomyces chumphonensis TaxID=1214925 RepID=A0A927EZL6_9ACTN|nr:hypothetical protein [Streptomyces chumphonensis]MBD3932393.1 hypothetical protein [Streptomyces chumphonensis]